MPMPLGASFAPTFENSRMQRPTTGGQPNAQALQVLSYQLKPRVAGAPGLSPLQGQQQAGSSIGQAVLRSVLRTVLGAGADELFQDGGGESSFSPGSMPGASGYDPGFAGVTPPTPRNPVIHPGEAPYEDWPSRWEEPPSSRPAPSGEAPTMPPSPYRDFFSGDRRMYAPDVAYAQSPFGGGGRFPF